MYYFAYGSNLNHKQMNCRCPENKFIERAFLDNYRFVYDGYSNKWEGAVANILESVDSIVWGGLYKETQRNRGTVLCLTIPHYR